VFIAEPPMWEALRQVCAREDKTVRKIATEIECIRVEAAFAPAIRVELLQYFWAAATEEGHRFVGHGSSLEDATAVTRSFVATAKRLPGG
jgi:predicted DNA-binding ribbon-helix-helix protein